MKSISVKIKALDNDLTDFNISLEDKLKYIPNIIHKSVPIGSNSNDNKVVKEWGVKPDFDFQPKSHLEIAEKLNLLDFKRSAKISGTAFIICS